ncbi:MAG: hypothetical protein HZB92_08175 [Euryarchaeota archaeon]|nr:hypothetical protein [Euryarchaeota archaeon]
MKGKIGVILLVGLLAFAAMGSVRAEGTASVTVQNATPTANITVLNSGWTLISTIIPNTNFYVNISVNDADGTDDVFQSNFTLRFPASGYATNNPSGSYKFGYDSVNDIPSQFAPTSGVYLNGVTEVDVSTTTKVLSFNIILNKTAIDSNGVLIWIINGTSEDLSGGIGTTSISYLGMASFVEITYATISTGTTNFAWTGAPESNVSSTFYTVVTSNDAYQLNASYTGFFLGGSGEAWGVPTVDPTIWVKNAGQSTATQLLNASASPGNNATWYSSTTGYMLNQTHYMNLVLPAGLAKNVVYTGVTIWIQAKNV